MACETFILKSLLKISESVRLIYDGLRKLQRKGFKS